MKRENILPGAAAFAGMLVLILDGKTALEGAQEGIELCLKAAVPALFPYFVLSILLTGALSGGSIPLLSPIGRALGIPSGCDAVLISGFLGGYPAGAQAICQLYRSQNLDRENAQRLLCFCSNAGPAFLFGIVGPLFPQRALPWLLWVIHIAGALLTAVVIPSPGMIPSSAPQSREVHLTEAVQGAIRAMASVCAWIILFRMVITFLQRWFLWLLPVPAQIAVAGFLELSNGCLGLSQVGDVRLRFLLCCCMLSFGGVCVTMQTKSVTGGLSLKYYLLGKMMQTVFCLVLSIALLYGIWQPAAILAGLLAIYLGKKQKSGSIPQKIGV